MKIIHERIYETVATSMTFSQIGAQKEKSVRNHLIVVNSVISDVLSTVKKSPIDLSIMDYRQMFDCEDAEICLDALYEAGVQNHIFAVITEANRENLISVKTPNGRTEKDFIRNKIMQGDVLGPLVSSNMVDRHIGRMAIATGNVYMYKDKVPIPPLAMIDDTLGISVCGVKTQKMNEFLNIRTSLMNLQFGCEKCEKMHVGKTKNTDICPPITIDSWEEKVAENEDGEKYLYDEFVGKEHMKEVEEKKYLGDILTKDGKNIINIKTRTNKAQGNVNKMVNTLDERPYGRHRFKAAKLMRDAILLSGLLTNSESWINVSKKDLDDLEKPDFTLQKKILSATGNPSKCFTKLELGILPVRYVFMKKRLNFLHYILNESMDSIMKQVYDTLKEDSRKGILFHYQILTEKC